MSSRASSGILRRDHERPLERALLRQPTLVQPAVVGAGERRRKRRIANHRQRQQVIGEQHRLVDVEPVEALAELARAGDDLTAVGPAWERHAVLGPRRHPGQIEVTLLHGRDLAQRDVPGRLGIQRELGRILVDVHVGIDHKQIGEGLAPCAGGFARRHSGRHLGHILGR